MPSAIALPGRLPGAAAGDAYVFSRGLVFSAVVAVLAIGGGCSSSNDPSPIPVAEQVIELESAVGPAADGAVNTGRCRIYPVEAGCVVFIDGEPVRDAAGALLIAPCQATASAGTHTVTLAQQGREDVSYAVLFGEDSEFVATETPPQGTSDLLGAPYLNHPVGQPVVLAALNTPGRELDPFVTRNGLSIWFVSDRPEGRGVYAAHRPGPLFPFGPAEILHLSRGADMPASPSVTADGLSIVYVLPEKSRIWELTRSEPLAAFEQRNPLLFSAEGGEFWPSAQILAGGDPLYFTRARGRIVETRVAHRQSPGAAVRESAAVDLPGKHPCLSADGLRQYLFDGESLRRAIRSNPGASFGPVETVVELSLTHYRPSLVHRQFWVSDDEQWMYYCDDPEASGDLWMVRLSAGKSRGVPLRGVSIENRTVAAAPAVEPEPAMEPLPRQTPPPQPAPDPRLQPLPYALVQQEFRSLMQEREYDAAARRLAAAETDSQIDAFRDLLAWDREDLAAVLRFWEHAETGAKSMQPGDEFRIGAARLTFEKYEEGVLFAQARSRDYQKPLRELEGAAVAGIADRRLSPDDAAAQGAVATFLFYERNIPASTRNARLASAGDAGVRLREQWAGRLLRLVEQEFSRNNIVAGSAWIDQVTTGFAGTDAAAVAVQLQESLYTRIRWTEAGKRKWDRGMEGEYTAASDRSPGALLVSPQAYGQFRLTMEYRTNESAGQGGVYFRYPGSGATDGRAFKIQLSTDPGIAPDPFCTGALFGYAAPVANRARAAGEWNTFEMQVDGEHVTVSINGERVLDADAIENGIAETGHVALDGVSGGISYRKVILAGTEVATGQ